VRKHTERLLAVLLGCGVGLVLAGGALEIGLRAAAWLVAGSPAPGRAAAEASPASFRILCIGDSNTYGTGVERSEAYPAQLERLLNERSGAARVEVTNLGVPGSNSSQVLHRLPRYVEIDEPDLVIVLIGVNDYWNPEEAESPPSASLGERLHRRLSHLRSYRLVLLLMEHLRSPGAPTDPDEVVLVNKEVRRKAGGTGDATVRELRHGGATFRFRNTERSVFLDGDEQVRLLTRNLREMIRIAGERKVPLVLATYAADVGPYVLPNRVIADQSGAYVVTSEFRADLRRYIGAPRPGLYFPDMHPRPPVYAAYAKALRDALWRWSLVPGSGAEPGGPGAARTPGVGPGASSSVRAPQSRSAGRGAPPSSTGSRAGRSSRTRRPA
jgi:lysophospholipase L1-like esterase